MASRIEAFFLGLANALFATLIGYGVVRDEIAPGLVFLAASCAFHAVVFAAKFAVLSVQQEGEHRG